MRIAHLQNFNAGKFCILHTKYQAHFVKILQNSDRTCTEQAKFQLGKFCKILIKFYKKW